MPDEPESEIGSALERVRELRVRLEELLLRNGLEKSSVTDYTRLMQMERDLDGDAPKDISVSWIDTLADDKNE